MALSAHELRIIKDLEERLTAEDSRLARIFRRNVKHHLAARKLLRGFFAVTPGLSLMIIALSIPSVPLGIGAFLAMCAGAYVFTFPPGTPALLRGGRKNHEPFHSTSPQ
jgi:hypothetical protein